MKNKAIEVICQYSDEGDLIEIFLQSFCYYLQYKFANNTTNEI